MNKICKVCKIEKSPDLFYKSNKSTCKECSKKKTKEQYNENKKDILIQSKIYREKNKEKLVNYRKERYNKNKEELLNKNKIYYEKNKQNVLKTQKKRREIKKVEIKKQKQKNYQENKKEIIKKVQTYYQENKAIISEKSKIRYWKRPKCIKCNYNIANKKFDNYCFDCFCYYFPNDERCKSKRLFKQHYIHKNIILPNFSKYLVSYDISLGCSGKRPDWVFNIDNYFIVLECDEEQHYNNKCEEKREMEIFKDLGNKPIIFIRFNPDSYKLGKQKIDGCFIFEKSLIINEHEFIERKDKLINRINYWINNSPNKEVNKEYLFYNI